ncbi:MAG: M23 family metallopeptidase [Magnetococcales bacterium]|nr:M23 family metallopeptidase [Magnetococcales bacterium]
MLIVMKSKKSMDRKKIGKKKKITNSNRNKHLSLVKAAPFVGLMFLSLLFVLTYNLISGNQSETQNELDEHGVMFLSESSKTENSLSYSKDFSDLNPTLDSITEIFNSYTVKIPTHTSQDRNVSSIIDSLVMDSLVSLEIENISMRQRLLQEIPSGYPVPFRGVTSDYGMRIHPISGNRLLHSGVDLRANIGTPVISTADGIIEFTGVEKKYRARGLTVIIDHNYGFKTVYGHLKKIVVKQGDFIKKGEVVAFSGNSGITNGPHLHYGVHFLNSATNPINYVKWGPDNFDSLFKLEARVKWSSLIDRINKKVQREGLQAKKLVNTNQPIQ